MRRLAILIGVLSACGGGGAAPEPQREFGGDRAVTLEPPKNLDASKSYPLILVLHGYGASGFVQAAVFQTSLVAGDAFVLAPDGTVDSTGKEFWNADPECCDFDHTGVDDVGYLSGLIDDVRAAWPMIGDVFIEGHSNGGYMAYRMACERADAISAIVSLAGNAATTPANCTPSQPVSVLHLHGTADDTVPFDGTPGANSDVAQWAQHDGCGGGRIPSGTIDLVVNLPGAETTQTTSEGCPAGVSVDLWAIGGGSHIPNFVTTFGTTLFQWLTAHARE